MEERLFGIASKVATPLSLASITIIVLYLLYRQILNLDIFSTLAESSTFSLLNTMIMLLFYLALAGLVLGVASFIYVKYSGGADVKKAKRNN